MSQSRLQKSRSRRKIIQNISATNLLHQGLKRRLTSAEYTTMYPKTKLSLKNRPNTITILKNECSEEEMHRRIYRMKEQNKTLEQQNHDLVTKIRKESKLNDIFDKKLEQNNIEEMPFQKLLQIKLLLEVEDLEEQFTKTQHQLAQLIKNTKKRREDTSNSSIETQVQVLAILSDSPERIQDMKRLKQQKIAQIYEKQASLEEKMHRIKQTSKQKVDQIKKLTATVDKQKAKLPNKNEWAVESNDSGIHSLQNKNKSMEQLQKEIVRSRQEYKSYEIKIQQAIDKKVAEKILLYKQIQETKSESYSLQKTQFNKPRTIRW